MDSGDVGTWVGGIGSAAAAVAAVAAARSASQIAREDRKATFEREATERKQDGLQRRLDLLLQLALAFEDTFGAINNAQPHGTFLGKVSALAQATNDKSLLGLPQHLSMREFDQGRAVLQLRITEVQRELDALQFARPA